LKNQANYVNYYVMNMQLHTCHSLVETFEAIVKQVGHLYTNTISIRILCL